MSETLRVDLANALSIVEREQMINYALLYCRSNGLEGNYYEFGVGAGRTFVNALTFAEKHGMLEHMHFFGYDSFEGLPEPTGIDIGGPFNGGDYKYTKEYIENLIPERFREYVTLVPGWYEDTLVHPKDHYVPYDCAIAWIDCDLYYSTKSVMEFLAHKLMGGSVVILDDWFTFRADPRRGEQKAFREFVKKWKWKAQEFRKFSWHGNSFIVRK